jgi:RNA:NAD 2'-phosphotransferase (TPT1/KptA family)
MHIKRFGKSHERVHIAAEESTENEGGRKAEDDPVLILIKAESYKQDST